MSRFAQRLKKEKQTTLETSKKLIIKINMSAISYKKIVKIFLIINIIRFINIKLFIFSFSSIVDKKYKDLLNFFSSMS